ncbi:MAG TPA: type II toxin-antitoxin system HicB family antitoxin [Castellaniella sp.]|uniref:type II toxin-antitoxin system HicB family antitoxin n=1 Tax=Castellaniella sp. TaxID=1955812 RepID=UPI002EE5DF71
MSNTLEYRGYLGSVEFSADDRCLCGKVEFIDALILFDGTSVAELEQAFHSAVDAYLQSCVGRQVEPDQPFKGSFNVRIGAGLHKQAAYEAKRQGITLNEFVARSIQGALPSEPHVATTRTQQAAARRLAKLGGSSPNAEPIRRRRSITTARA